MPRLKNAAGSIVNVADEQVAAAESIGFELIDEKKAPAKKAASPKSED